LRGEVRLAVTASAVAGQAARFPHLAVLLLLASLSGCADGPAPTAPQPAAAIIVLPGEAEIAVGATRQFSAVVLDAAGDTMADPEVIWSSSDTTVVVVDSTGLGMAVGDGRALVVGVSSELVGVAAVTAATVTPTLTVASWFHTCALTSTGETYCWGANDAGQLGIGSADREPHAIPVRVATELTFASLTAGGGHTCGVTIGGAAYCWGLNADGQLGDGSGVDAYTPVRVAGGLTFRFLDAGAWHTCGLTTDGVAYCWGENERGQLGDGSTTDRWSPVPVSGGWSFVSLSAGESHTCGLTDRGEAFCWGWNQSWLGVYYIYDDTTTPRPVYGGLVFQALSAGSVHSCGLSDGAAYCWGANAYGSLGTGLLGGESNRPVPVAGGLEFRSIEAGLHHSVCGITVDGDAYCWGHNDFGMLGDGTTEDQPAPVPVIGGFKFRLVNSNVFHGCGLTTSYEVYCWGHNFTGMLGDGTTERSLVPVRVLLPPLAGG
jgi:alpha-tubulin suppressor-like RCC1 family protein